MLLTGAHFNSLDLFVCFFPPVCLYIYLPLTKENFSNNLTYGN